MRHNDVVARESRRKRERERKSKKKETKRKRREGRKTRRHNDVKARLPHEKINQWEVTAYKIEFGGSR